MQRLFTFMFTLLLVICNSLKVQEAKAQTFETYLRIPVVDLDQDLFRQVIVDKEPGQYLGHPTTLLLEDNEKDWDTTYPGVELLADGTFISTTYGHWENGEEPYILSVRFSLKETDVMLVDATQK